MYQFIIVYLLILSSSAYGEDDSCKYFKFCGSNSAASSAKRSSSSIASAARLNPSVVSKIRGLGVESLYQGNNPIEFNLVTGNGKLGGMITSSSGENSFFGNRTIELDDDYFSRSATNKRYKNNKLQLALGAGLIAKKYFEFNIGVSGIKNKDTDKINLGYAISGKLSFINFGLYQYKDDIKLDLVNHVDFSRGTYYDVLYGVSTYQEDYDVSVYTVGTNLYNLSVDAAFIKTQYEFYNKPTNISILSTSLSVKRFLINFAHRNETSENLLYKNGSLIYQQKKNDIYAGLQFLPNQHLLLGLGYNNYLLHELSMTLTLFI